MMARWTDSEVDTLRRMVGEGEQAGLIAQKIGRSQKAVSMKIHDLVKRGDISSSQRNTEKRLRVRVWTEKADAKLIKMIGDGVDISTIAKRLGRTERALRDRVRRLQAQGHDVPSLPDRRPWGPSDAPPPYIHAPHYLGAVERARDRAYAMLAAGDDPSSVRHDIKQMHGVDLGDMSGLRPAGEAARRVLSGLEARK